MPSDNKPFKAHNDDLLRKSDLDDFCKWLAGQDIVVRRPSAKEHKSGVTRCVISRSGQLLHIREARGSGQKYLRTALGLGPLVAQFLKRPVSAAVSAATIREAMPPRKAPAPAKAQETLESKKKPLTVHEQDLRDDFAIHAPLQKLPEESLRDFANRRWEYADLMLETRC